MNILNVPMNDLKAIEAYYVQQGSIITQDELQLLMRLQEDFEAFDKLTADWNIVESNSDLPIPAPGVPRP